MEHILTYTSVISAAENAIRKWIPEIVIPMPQPPQTVAPLNIFTEMGARDPVTGAFLLPAGQETPEMYPYLFIQEDRRRTDRERFGDGRERTHYNSELSLTLYIDVNPFDRSRIPKLNETLRTVELDLQRVLKYLEIWGGLVETFNDIPSRITDGVLHVFLSVPYYEDTVLPEHDKVEVLKKDIVPDDVKLPGQAEQGILR